MPADIAGDAQTDDERNLEVDIDKPAYGILRRAHAQEAKGDIAEKSEEQQAEQGNVEFDVQRFSL